VRGDRHALFNQRGVLATNARRPARMVFVLSIYKSIDVPLIRGSVTRFEGVGDAREGVGDAPKASNSGVGDAREGVGDAREGVGDAPEGVELGGR